MKKFSIMLLFVFFTSISFAQENNALNLTNSIDWNEPIKNIPPSYLHEIEQKGNVVKLNYSSKAYNKQGEILQKYAYVYLPYNYTESEQYNVLYLLHGGGGNAERYFKGEGKSSELKRILDNMIAQGDIKPLIVVTPTFYPINNADTSVATASIQTALFHQELINDLVPAVEKTYRTYANTTDLKGLQASRQHRAFGGFSMGSVATWYTLIHCLDYFAYFMPMSGDCWIIAQRGN